jgi:hypothetical protein
MKIISVLFFLAEFVFAFSVGTSLSIMDNKMLHARFNQHLSPMILYSQKLTRIQDGFKLHQLRRKLKKIYNKYD